MLFHIAPRPEHGQVHKHTHTHGAQRTARLTAGFKQKYLIPELGDKEPEKHMGERKCEKERPCLEKQAYHLL